MDDYMQWQVDKQEKFDWVTLEKALQKNCSRECTLMPMPSGNTYDAKFYVMDDNGKMKLNSYIEIKCFNCLINTHKEAIIKKHKIDELVEIRDNDHINTILINIYPYSNCYISYTLNEIEKCRIEQRWLKEKEMSLSPKKKLYDVYMLPILTKIKRSLHL